MKLDGIRKTLHQADKVRYRPATLVKAARGYFRTLVLRKPTLRIVEFSITPACQSNCGYCYAAKFQRPGETMLTPEEIGQAWRQASRLGAFQAFLLGGEPSLRKDFLEIARVLEPKRNIVRKVVMTEIGIAKPITKIDESDRRNRKRTAMARNPPMKMF